MIPPPIYTLRRTGPLVVLLFCGLLLSISGIHGQEEVQAEELNEGEYVIRAGGVESWVEKDQRITLLTGGVELTSAKDRLRARTVLGWTPVDKGDGGDGKDQGLRDEKSVYFREIYASGYVRYEKGREGNEIFEAEQLYLNNASDYGLAETVTYRSRLPERDQPIVIRANQFEIRDRNLYTARDVSFTTCDFEAPHYRVEAGRMTVYRKEESIDARGVVPWIGGVPVFYLPAAYLDRDFIEPIRKVEYGRNDRFDEFLYTRFRFPLYRYRRDEQGNVRKKNDRPVSGKWGSLDVLADWRERRGPALGPKLDYSWEGYEGFLDAYGMNDRKGPNPEVEFDRQFLPKEKDFRGRAWWFHRQFLYSDDEAYEFLRFDLEVNKVSDRNFMQEFFETEFKTGKDRESYGYLRYADENVFATGTGRVRINSFQTQTEYLPGITLSVDGEPLGKGFLYSSRTDLSDLRERPDEDLSGARMFETTRVDTYQEVSRPFSVGPLRARPFLGGRGSYYDRDASQTRSIDRHILSGGLSLNQKFHRVYDTPSDLLGLNGLRHVVEAKGKYTNNFHSNRSASDLHQFDTTDAHEAFEEVYLELTSRFETRDNDGEAYQFLDTGVGAEYYPDADRDRATVREQNVLQPFSWIPTNRSPRNGTIPDRNWSALYFRLSFTPNLPFSLSGRMEVEPNNQSLLSTVGNLNVSVTDRLSASVSHSYIRDLVETTDYGLDYQLSDRWDLTVRATYDERLDEFQKREASLSHEFHDFRLSLGYIDNNRRDDQIVTISLSPVFLQADERGFELYEARRSEIEGAE